MVHAQSSKPRNGLHRRRLLKFRRFVFLFSGSFAGFVYQFLRRTALLGSRFRLLFLRRCRWLLRHRPDWPGKANDEQCQQKDPDYFFHGIHFLRSWTLRDVRHHRPALRPRLCRLATARPHLLSSSAAPPARDAKADGRSTYRVHTVTPAESPSVPLRAVIPLVVEAFHPLMAVVQVNEGYENC